MEHAFPLSSYAKQYFENNDQQSPPKEQIIKSADVHPKTIGLYESTKKLILAPTIKEDIGFYRNNDLRGYDRFNNPLSTRFLERIPPGPRYNPTNVQDSNNDFVIVQVIIDGMINSLVKLNRENAKRVENHESSNIKLDDFVFYNSLHTLNTFVNIMEIHRSKTGFIYLGKNRFDNLVYVLKTGVNSLDRINSQNISESNVRSLREGQILSSARHDNIVRYHSSWFEQQVYFIQLEYMIGCTLSYIWYSDFQFFEICSLPELNPLGYKLTHNSTVKLLRHMSSAIDYIHNTLHLIHNNINAKHIFAALDEHDVIDNEAIIAVKKTQIIRSVSYYNADKVIFKLFDFFDSFSDTETSVRNNSDKCINLGEIEDEKYRDIFHLGLVLAEAFIPKKTFDKINFLTDDLDKFIITNDENMNKLIKRMLDRHALTLMTVKDLIREIETLTLD